MSKASVATTQTRIGPFTAIVADDGAVLASGWTAERGELLPQVHPSLRPTQITETTDLGPVTAAIRAFHDGDVTAIDDIPVRQRGGDFIQHAWQVLRKVPAGAPVTYTEYAALAGRPSAVRAAASACASNPAALFVPCHRVVRVGGALGGFRWGIDVKRALLSHEQQHAPTR